VEVPGRISVVGCDDIFGADFCHPPLTTLSGPAEQAGRAAVSLLLGRLDDPAAPAARRAVLLPTHLTVRESTGPASPMRDRQG
jgi:LacI family transcriptional regulator